MSEEKKEVFKCPNDFKVTMSKHNGEVMLDEECCTAVSIILKNTGEIATSFFGAHNKDVIRILEKTLKVYFKSIKKTLKTEESMEKEIKVVGGDIPKEDKWNGEDVPEVEGYQSPLRKTETQSNAKTDTKPKKINQKSQQINNKSKKKVSIARKKYK